LNNQGFYFHLNITPFKQVNTTLDERDKKQRTASRKKKKKKMEGKLKLTKDHPPSPSKEEKRGF
jgi:hypothetical protein